MRVVMSTGLYIWLLKHRIFSNTVVHLLYWWFNHESLLIQGEIVATGKMNVIFTSRTRSKLNLGSDSETRTRFFSHFFWQAKTSEAPLLQMSLQMIQKNHWTYWAAFRRLLILWQHEHPVTSCNFTTVETCNLGVCACVCRSSVYLVEPLF